MPIFNERWHVFAQKFSGTLNYKLKWNPGAGSSVCQIPLFSSCQLKQLPSSWHLKKQRRTLSWLRQERPGDGSRHSAVRGGPWVGKKALLSEGSFRRECHIWGEEGTPCSVCESRKSLPWSSWCLTCKSSTWEEFFIPTESCFLLSLEPPPQEEMQSKG